MAATIDDLENFSMTYWNRGKEFPYRDEKIGVYALGIGIAKGPYKRSARYLENYYRKYDIPFYVATEDNERLWGTFHKLKDGGISHWHSAVTSRFQLLHQFLETDQEYFILQDLDYVVINQDMDIRRFLPDFVAPNWIYTPEQWMGKAIRQRKYQIQTDILKSYDSSINMDAMRHICADFIGMTRLEVENMMKFYKECGVDTSDTNAFADWCCKLANTKEDINNDGWKKHMQEEELFATYCAGKNINPTKIEETKIRMDCWGMHRDTNENWLKEVIKLIHCLEEKGHIFLHFGGCEKINFFDNILDVFEC